MEGLNGAMQWMVRKAAIFFLVDSPLRSLVLRSPPLTLWSKERLKKKNIKKVLFSLMDNPLPGPSSLLVDCPLKKDFFLWLPYIRKSSFYRIFRRREEKECYKGKPIKNSSFFKVFLCKTN